MNQPTSDFRSVFPGADLDSVRGADLNEAVRIRSIDIIAHMAKTTGTSRTEAARVVDGFWEYLVDLDGNYRRTNKGWLLVIPHFGTFRGLLGYAAPLTTSRLTFRSRTLEERTTAVTPRSGLFGRMKKMFGSAPAPSESAPTGAGVTGSWVSRPVHDPSELSVKRRIAFAIHHESGMDISVVAVLLDSLFTTLLSLFDRGRRNPRRAPVISWPRRGRMVPDLRVRPDGAAYRFVSSKSLRCRLPVA